MKKNTEMRDLKMQTKCLLPEKEARVMSVLRSRNEFMLDFYKKNKNKSAFVRSVYMQTKFLFLKWEIFKNSALVYRKSGD